MGSWRCPGLRALMIGMRPKIYLVKDQVVARGSSAELEPATARPGAPALAAGAHQQRDALLQLLKWGDKAELGTVLDGYLDAPGLGEQCAPGLLGYVLTDSVLLAAGF